MATVYSQEIYNDITANKKFNEELIDEIYGNYSNMTFEDKLLAMDIINDLKELNDEYSKYIIAYQQKVKSDKVKSQYIIKEGDTLQSIAYKLTGTISNWQAIYKYNELTDVKLVPGDVLSIPEVE